MINFHSHMLSRSICSLCCSTSFVIHKFTNKHKGSIQTVVKFKAIYYITLVLLTLSLHIILLLLNFIKQ